MRLIALAIAGAVLIAFGVGLMVAYPPVTSGPIQGVSVMFMLGIVLAVLGALLGLGSALRLALRRR